MRTRSFSLCAVVLALFLSVIMTGCGNDTTSTQMAVSSVPKGGKVVTSNPKATVSWIDTQAISHDSIIWIRLVYKGLEVQKYPCTFTAAKTEFGENLISCVIDSAIPIGPGCSGATIGRDNPKTGEEEVIGMLCYGSGSIGDLTHFKARHIDEVTAIGTRRGTDVHTTRAIEGQSSIGYKPLGNITFLSGISQFELERLERLGLKIPEGTRLVSSVDKSRTRNRALETVPVIAGMKVSVNDITGDIYTGGAIGTIGFVTEDSLFIFAHEYERAGETDIPATLADVTSFTGGLTPFVDATPLLDCSIGSLTGDYREGGIINRKKVAQTIPVKLTGTIGGRQVCHLHNIVRGNKDKEAFYLTLATIAIVDFDRSKYAKGTVSGTMTLTFVDGSETLNLQSDDPKDVVASLYQKVNDFLTEKLTDSRELVSVDMSIIVSDDYLEVIHGAYRVGLQWATSDQVVTDDVPVLDSEGQYQIFLEPIGGGKGIAKRGGMSLEEEADSIKWYLGDQEIAPPYYGTGQPQYIYQFEPSGSTTYKVVALIRIDGKKYRAVRECYSALGLGFSLRK